MTGEKKIITAKCLSITHLAYIKRSDMIEVLKAFPEDYVKDNNIIFSETIKKKIGKILFL